MPLVWYLLFILIVILAAILVVDKEISVSKAMIPCYLFPLCVTHTVMYLVFVSGTIQTTLLQMYRRRHIVLCVYMLYAPFFTVKC